jgi:hypothetical protein
VLKSGCRIEDIAHETADRIRRAVAINLVIAWRIMLMTLLGRETPGLPAEVSAQELRAPCCWVKRHVLSPRSAAISRATERSGSRSSTDLAWLHGIAVSGFRVLAGGGVHFQR